MLYTLWTNELSDKKKHHIRFELKMLTNNK